MKKDEPFDDALGVLAAALEPVEPPERLRARLMTALEGPARYLPFCQELAARFDLSEARMRELLARIDDPARWIKGEPPIEGYVHFRPGARFVPLHGGFFRMLGGTGFPMHRHDEPELTFVLSGRLRDDKGELYDPGDVLDMPAGSAHALHVPDETPALVAVLGGRIAVVGD